MWNAKSRSGFGWTSFPLALIIVSVLLMLLNVQLPFTPVVPLEVSPSQIAEVSIVKDTLLQNILRAAVGSGPGTFVYDYAQFHSSDLNNTIFWGTRFTSGASEILDWTATKGILGLISLLSLIGAGLFVGARYMVREVGGKIRDNEEPKNTDWILTLGVFASFAAVALGLFIYTANFTQWFLFWMLLASLALFTGSKLRTFSLTSHSFLALGSSFGFLVVLIFGLGLLFLGGQKYAAEVQYSKGVSASRGGDIDKAITKISSAASMNGSIDIYWRDLAQLYVQKANQVIVDQSLSAQEQQIQASLVVRNAVHAAQQSILVAPKNVANHNVQGFVYRSILGVPGAQGFAISSYEKAAELEPASPFGWTELGRVNILYAQQSGDQEAFEAALESLKKAVELKDDYAPAHYLIAVVYGQQGKTEEAIEQLEKTKIIAPSDVGLAFQLGTIYWQRNEFEKARGEFERARLINPNHSNSRYMLGLVYDKLGEAEKSKEEFTRVADINPDNEEVRQILRNLRAGRSALFGIVPSEPPIEETPPEIPGEASEEVPEDAPGDG
ncbi:tetratricopeptide repeat protein [Patescibacteria group bacterium]|nr:tetratricopeptide repeat protein [Patescibacteria group bacterium]